MVKLENEQLHYLHYECYVHENSLGSKLSLAKELPKAKNNVGCQKNCASQDNDEVHSFPRGSKPRHPLHQQLYKSLRYPLSVKCDAWNDVEQCQRSREGQHIMQEHFIDVDWKHR